MRHLRGPTAARFSRSPPRRRGPAVTLRAWCASQAVAMLRRGALPPGAPARPPPDIRGHGEGDDRHQWLHAPAIERPVPLVGAQRRRLSALLDAPLVLSGYSRLVIDCNRAPEAADASPAVSDGIAIPANLNRKRPWRLFRWSPADWPRSRRTRSRVLRSAAPGAPDRHDGRARGRRAHLEQPTNVRHLVGCDQHRPTHQALPPGPVPRRRDRWEHWTPRARDWSGHITARTECDHARCRMVLSGPRTP